MIMLRFLRHVENEIKKNVPEFHAVGMTPGDYHSVIGANERAFHSIGYDISAMDRNTPALILHEIFDALKEIDPSVVTWIEQQVIYGPIVDGYGKLHCRSGGNPSGQLWTTMVNCLVSYAMHKATQKKMGKDKPYDYQFRVVGDDGLVWFSNTQHLALFKTTFTTVADSFGYTLKWAPEVTPPGIGGVFLDTAMHYWRLANGLMTTFALPARIERSLPKIVQLIPGVDRKDILRGVMDRFTPMYYYFLDNRIPLPEALLFLVSEFQNAGLAMRTRQETEDVFITGVASIDTTSYVDESWTHEQRDLFLLDSYPTSLVHPEVSHLCRYG
jgi:hypothetical protein